MYNPGCYPGLGASALSGRAGNRNSSHSLKPAIIDSGRAGNRTSGHSLKPAIIDSGRAGNRTSGHSLKPAIIDSGRAGNLHQFKNLTRRLPLQHFQLEVLSGNDALAPENLLHGLSRQFGMIVLLAEMAEPDMAKDWCGIIG